MCVKKKKKRKVKHVNIIPLPYAQKSHAPASKAVFPMGVPCLVLLLSNCFEYLFTTLRSKRGEYSLLSLCMAVVV